MEIKCEHRLLTHHSSFLSAVPCFPQFCSYAEKSSSDKIEILRRVLIHFSIYFIQQRFRFDSFTLQNAGKCQVTHLQRFSTP